MTGIEVAASIIPIVYQAFDLAKKVQELIQNVRHHDEKMEDLEDKLETLKTILKVVRDAYGQNGSTSSQLDRQLRQTIEHVVEGCNKDLKDFEVKLERLVARGNWASVAWRQQFVAPALIDIGKSLSERQQLLTMLVQNLQGLELREMLKILREFCNAFSDKAQPGDLSEDQSGDTGSLEQEATSLIKEAELAIDHLSRPTLDDGNERPQAQEHSESKELGLLLLKAIDDGDEDTFESLLSNGETSLVEKDAQERTAVLLAASLKKISMMERLLASGTERGNRQEIDLTATDNVGRTLLHYCAEFGLEDQARILLDNDVSIDAWDYVDHPPAYYAVKERQYKVLKLLLEKGASTAFDWELPDGTSLEIKELLKKASENERSALESSPG